MQGINNHITVVMPVFNRPEFLTEALQSVWGQRYDRYELIIVDDGSDDKNVLEIFLWNSSV